MMHLRDPQSIHKQAPAQRGKEALAPEERLAIETRGSAQGLEDPLCQWSLTWLSCHSVDLTIGCPSVLTVWLLVTQEWVKVIMFL